MITLVTGADGFVGSALCERLCGDARMYRGSVRSLPSQLDFNGKVAIGNISSKTDWTAALDRVDLVVHLAGRAHVMDEKESNPLAEFRLVNVDGTVNLARQAAAAGVRRFIFLSTVKVNGEFSLFGQAFTADDVPSPKDPYGISKYEAEQLLLQIASETGMEVVIIRPPLVYGPGVKANFRSMMLWLTRGMPLPLASVTRNRRSFVALANLVDLIVTCLNHPAAANQIFLVSDGDDLSTVELLRRMGVALGRDACLFSVHPLLLKLGASMIKKNEIYQRLCESLQLDIAKTRRMLGWTPPISIDEGFRRAAEAFRR